MGVTPEEISASSSTSPALNAVAVVPADADLTDFTRSIYVGTTGDLVVVMAGIDVNAVTAVTFSNVVAGSVLPIRARQIRAATTASDIVAMF